MGLLKRVSKQKKKVSTVIQMQETFFTFPDTDCFVTRNPLSFKHRWLFNLKATVTSV
jgi:hypothetical protein